MNIYEECQKRVIIIAEACDNHMGNLEKAKEMARQAKLAGADVIKYQHHLPDYEMLPDVPMSDNFDIPLYDFLKLHALSIEQHKILKEYCEEIGITYLCTPFSYQAAIELNEIGVDGFKIGSGEMTDVPSLCKIADFKKTMIISTGMCDFDEIERTYNALMKKNVELILMNCVSEYPPVYEDINLNVIKQMEKFYPNAIIGHSDHTPDLYTSFAAVALGARVIEKHITLDKCQLGPDQAVSIDMHDLKNLVDGVRKIEKSLGNKKKIHQKESCIREWAFRSLVVTKDMKAGEILSEDNLWSKRPGTGIPSHLMEQYLGRVIKVDIKANTLLRESDVK